MEIAIYIMIGISALIGINWARSAEDVADALFRFVIGTFFGFIGCMAVMGVLFDRSNEDGGESCYVSSRYC